MLNKKLLLAHVREGDFTHPGEIEAIELMMSYVDCNPEQEILDVGCGLGGTADYFKQKGYGVVTALDIDPNAISYAKEHYPAVNFFECDVLNVSNIFPIKNFDLIYLFSSFYCFKDQKKSLESLCRIANSGCHLLIFDYATEEDYAGENPFKDDSSKPFNPINKDTIASMLKETGWSLINIVDLTGNFKKWYIELLRKMEEKKHFLVGKFGKDAFYINHHRFKVFLDYIELNKLGGKLICAVKD